MRQNNSATRGNFRHRVPECNPEDDIRILSAFYMLHLDLLALKPSTDNLKRLISSSVQKHEYEEMNDYCNQHQFPY